MRVVKDMGALGTSHGRPMKDMRIINCGLWDDENPAPVPKAFLQNRGPKMSEDEYLRRKAVQELQTRYSA